MKVPACEIPVKGWHVSIYIICTLSGYLEDSLLGLNFKSEVILISLFLLDNFSCFCFCLLSFFFKLNNLKILDQVHN